MVEKNLLILDDENFIDIGELIEKALGEDAMLERIEKDDVTGERRLVKVRKGLYEPKDVGTIVNVSYRQIQYWDRTNFIKPSYRKRGKWREYTEGDIFNLAVSKDLRNDGMSIQKMRRLMPKIMEAHDQIGFLTSYTLLLAPYLSVRSFGSEKTGYIDLSKL